MKKRILVLGSTGSIGKQALQVIDFHHDKLEVAGLAAYSSKDLLAEQCAAFGVPDHDSALTVRDGMDALLRLIDTTQPDIVLNALVGSAGLRATLHTLDAGLTLALANKESLIVGGELVMSKLRPKRTQVSSGLTELPQPLPLMLPVDSEHSAIFQCMQGGGRPALRRLWITASGGPFRGKTRDQLQNITAADALAHPTWDMGPKITIDSATLMNKGLEVIEAHYLFDIDYDDIKVLVQPKSLIHSMVEFVDGSTLGHLGTPDMRVPIQYAFSYPERWQSVDDIGVDYRDTGAIELDRADSDTFGCLNLAFQAGRAGGTAPCILNAANEVAVAAFLRDQIGFLDIEALVEEALSTFSADIAPLEDLAQVEELDAQVRAFVNTKLQSSISAQ